MVKGCEWECSKVKEATLILIDHLYKELDESLLVYILMEISPQHHSVMLGTENYKLKNVMQRTNTMIIFPDAMDPNIPSINKGSVTISGSIHDVYIVRQLLLGLLPIVIMFDLPESLVIDESLTELLQENQDVNISI